MVVVVLTAGGAALALYAYNTTKTKSPDRLERAVHGIKQQAGVMAAICSAIFVVLTALEKAKPPNGVGSDLAPGGRWAKAKRVVDLVEEVV